MALRTTADTDLGRRHGRLALVALLAAGLAWAATAYADAFGSAYYDAGSDTLVATLLYRGTNPDHRFTLRWGGCGTPGPLGVYQVAGMVLDRQWDDAALYDYSETVHLSLAGLRCRPAEVTLRTAPGFRSTVFIPARPTLHTDRRRP